MKANLGKVSEVSVAVLQRLVSDIERVFTRVPENARRVYRVPLNFAAPSVVPGVTSQTVTIDGVELGDTVLVGAPMAVPAGFHPPVAEVTAANTVRVDWLQFSGAGADPDGAGGVYTIDVWRH